MHEGKTFQLKKVFSVCGLECTQCKIYLAPYNPSIADRLVKMFENMWDNVKSEDFHCSTCRGEISDCWTKECWIRYCCVNEKKLDFCYQCQEFPCKRLEDHAKKNKRHLVALNNLKRMKRKTEKQSKKK
jgi:hypothetical protein